MKTMIYSLMILFLAAGLHITLMAQSTKHTNEMIKGEDQRIPVKPEELPEPVKKKLSEEPYKEWKIGEAYMVQEEKKFYEITLLRGQEKQVIKLDEDGNHQG